jgi:hypothetical protein
MDGARTRSERQSEEGCHSVEGFNEATKTFCLKMFVNLSNCIKVIFVVNIDTVPSMNLASQL